MRSYEIGGKKLHKLEVYDGSAMYIASFIVQILLQLVAMVVLQVTKVDDGFTKTLGGICLFSILNEIAIGTAPLIYSKIRSANLYASMGLTTKTDWRQWLFAIGIALATVAAFAPIANYFVEFVVWTGYDTSSLSTIVIDSPSALVVGLIVMCAIPAVCEEFLYRGMIARSFGDRGMIFGVLVSSALFAIMHGNPVQLVHQFCLGCVCAALYFMTRNIWLSVLAHFINNAVAIVGNYILTMNHMADAAMPWYIAVPMIVVGGALLAVLLWLFGRVSARARGRKDRYDACTDVKTIGERRLAVLFEEDDERAARVNEQIALRERLERCETPEMREIMTLARKEETDKIARRSRMSLIYAFVLALLMWIVNTVSGYLL